MKYYRSRYISQYQTNISIRLVHPQNIPNFNQNCYKVVPEEALVHVKQGNMCTSINTKTLFGNNTINQYIKFQLGLLGLFVQY